MAAWRNYRWGRCFLGRLTADEDLIRAVTDLGVREPIATACVSITGRISRLTVGTFDPHQQVYITRTEERPMEVVRGQGLPSTAGEAPFFMPISCWRMGTPWWGAGCFRKPWPRKPSAW